MRRGHLDLDRPGARLLVGVDDLHRPQRKPRRLVLGLHEPAVGRGVEVPHRLEDPGRVHAVGEDQREVDRDRTLQSHVALLITRLLVRLTKQAISQYHNDLLSQVIRGRSFAPVYPTW
jgi:hypothetical protein